MENSKEEFYSPNYKVVRWVLLLGVLWCLPSAAVSIIGGAFIFEQSVEAYSVIPGIEAPAIAEFGKSFLPDIPVWVMFSLLALQTLLVLFTGLLLVFKFRPADWKADLLLGSTTGLVAGISVLYFGVGWALIIGEAPGSSLSELGNMSKAVAFLDQEVQVMDKDVTREKLLDSFPYLRELEPTERGDVLHAKVLADLTMGSADVAFVGIPATLVTYILLLLFPTLIAGFVFREVKNLGSSFWILGIELTLSSTPLFTFIMPTSILPYFSPPPAITPETLIVLAGAMIMTFIALSGVKRGWSWYYRYPGYAVVIIGAVVLAT